MRVRRRVGGLASAPRPPCPSTLVVVTARRVAIWCTGTAVAALVVAGCSGGDSETDRAQDAAEKLQEGLDAHVAGDVDEAKQLYEETLELDDRNQFAEYNLGVIDHQADRADDAEEHYRKAIELDPHLTSALFNLAIVEAEAGATDEAASLYERVIELDDSHAGAHLNLGFLHRDRGHHDEAQAELDRAVALDPNLASRVR
jgi:tetratricopeptide (TPR) repeat protein